MAGGGRGARSGDGVAVGACRGVVEDLDKTGFDLVRDDVLPAVGFLVHLVPGETDDVGEEPFCEPVLADDAGGELLARSGKRQRPSLDFHVTVFTKAVDHLRDRGGGVADPFGQASLDDVATFLLEIEDGLQVLLDWGMQAIGHALRIRPPPQGEPRAFGSPTDGPKTLRTCALGRPWRSLRPFGAPAGRRAGQPAAGCSNP